MSSFQVQFHTLCLLTSNVRLGQAEHLNYAAAAACIRATKETIQSLHCEEGVEENMGRDNGNGNKVQCSN